MNAFIKKNKKPLLKRELIPTNHCTQTLMGKVVLSSKCLSKSVHRIKKKKERDKIILLFFGSVFCSAATPIIFQNMNIFNHFRPGRF